MLMRWFLYCLFWSTLIWTSQASVSPAAKPKVANVTLTLRYVIFPPALLNIPENVRPAVLVSLSSTKETFCESVVVMSMVITGKIPIYYKVTKMAGLRLNCLVKGTKNLTAKFRLVEMIDDQETLRMKPISFCGKNDTAAVTFPQAWSIVDGHELTCGDQILFDYIYECDNAQSANCTELDIDDGLMTSAPSQKLSFDVSGILAALIISVVFLLLIVVLSSAYIFHMRRASRKKPNSTKQSFEEEPAQIYFPFHLFQQIKSDQF